MIQTMQCSIILLAEVKCSHQVLVWGSYPVSWMRAIVRQFNFSLGSAMEECHKENQISFGAEILAFKPLSTFSFLSPDECPISPLRKSAV